MKFISRFLAILLFQTVAVMYANASKTLIISRNDGTKESVSILDIQKLTFSSQSMTVFFTDGAFKAFTVSDVRSVSFGSTVTSIRTASEILPGIRIIRNPVLDVLQFSLDDKQEGSGMVTVISTEGRVVLQQVFEYTEGLGSVSVSSLPAGLYLCRVLVDQKTCSLKMMKK
jgi:hypothetical protein